MCGAGKSRGRQIRAKNSLRLCAGNAYPANNSLRLRTRQFRRPGGHERFAADSLCINWNIPPPARERRTKSGGVFLRRRPDKFLKRFLGKFPASEHFGRTTHSPKDLQHVGRPIYPGSPGGIAPLPASKAPNGFTPAHYQYPGHLSTVLVSYITDARRRRRKRFVPRPANFLSADASAMAGLEPGKMRSPVLAETREPNRRGNHPTHHGRPVVPAIQEHRVGKISVMRRSA
jgi:hypothetical protein